MTAEKATQAGQQESTGGAPDQADTVQVLVADSGNRSAIQSMLEDRYTVETAQTLQDADLYLIEDTLLPEYQDELCDRIERSHPEFCPVVLIERPDTNLTRDKFSGPDTEGAVLIDDVVSAPIDPARLRRRLESLLVRRRQSKELNEKVATLEDRERTLRRLKHGVESTGNGLVITDLSGNIEYLNPGVEEMTGYSEAELIRESLTYLLPDDSEDIFSEKFWRTLTDRAEWEEEFIFERADGNRRVATATVTSLLDADGDAEGFVIVMSDSTQRIQQEQALESREEQLDLLRQILSRYLRHNLRNELNVILGYAELLEMEDDLSDDHLDWIQRILNTTNRLMNKGETARTYSTLLEEDVSVSMQNLSEIVTTAVNTVSETYPDITFDVDISESCEIHARKGIVEAISELLENAAIHNDSAEPRVRVRVDHRDAPRLTIEDNGPGISEHEVDAIDRGKETPLSHSQGSGLWLSKWLIEDVNGVLTLEPTDVGTCVTVEFPSPESFATETLDVPSLHEREQRVETITDRMTDATIEVDASWNIAFVDAEAEEILDFAGTGHVGHSLWNELPALVDTPFEELFRDVMASRESSDIEAYYPGIDGWLEVYIYPEFDGGLSFYFQDVTDRVERKRRYSAIFNQTFQFTGLLEPDGTILEANDTALQFGGFEREDVVGIPFWESGWWPQDEQTRREVRQAVTRAAGGEFVRYEVEIQGAEGPAMIDFSIRPITDETGEVILLIPEGRDITEHHEREQQLNQLKREFETVFNAAQDALFLFDVVESDGEYGFELRRLNPTHEAATGLSSEEHRGATPREIVGEEQGAAISANLRRCLEAKEPIQYTEVLEMPTGPITWQTKLGPVITDGAVTQIVGIARDITERQQREQELEDASRRLDLALDATQTGVWEWNLETDEVVWDETLERLLGIEPGSFGGSFDDFAAFLHPDDSAKVEAAVEDALTGGEYHTEFRMERGDGEEIWVECRAELFTEHGERNMIGTTTDITNRKETEHALARREMVDHAVELEFHSDQLGQLIQNDVAGNLEFTLEGVVPESDGRQVLYGKVNGVTADEFQPVLDAIPPVEQSRLLRSVGETLTYEVTVGSESLAAIFASFDGELLSFALANDTLQVVGEFPEQVDTEAVTAFIQDRHPDVELVSQRRVVIPAYLKRVVEDDLTARERTVLGMAHYEDYFQQPRGSTGEELADRIGITKQTFDEHLRKAESKVFQALFEKDVDIS